MSVKIGPSETVPRERKPLSRGQWVTIMGAVASVIVLAVANHIWAGPQRWWTRHEALFEFPQFGIAWLLGNYVPRVQRFTRYLIIAVILASIWLSVESLIQT